MNKKKESMTKIGSICSLVGFASLGLSLLAVFQPDFGWFWLVTVVALATACVTVINGPSTRWTLVLSVSMVVLLLLCEGFSLFAPSKVGLIIWAELALVYLTVYLTSEYIKNQQAKEK